MPKLEIQLNDRTEDAEDITKCWLGRTDSSIALGKLRFKDGRIGWNSLKFRTDFIFGRDALNGNQYCISERGREYDCYTDDKCDAEIFKCVVANFDFVLRQIHYLNKFNEFWVINSDKTFTPKEMIVRLVKIRASFDRDEAITYMKKVKIA